MCETCGVVRLIVFLIAVVVVVALVSQCAVNSERIENERIRMIQSSAL